MASYDDLYKAGLADRKAKELKKAEAAKKRKKKKEVVKEETPETTE
tara:strand:- start:18 stop:155 length:138 start_codon:yes stop_codon:yes gene_type:complete